MTLLLQIVRRFPKDILDQKTNAHELSMDVCTIVKGCVFEWALNDGKMDIHEVLIRILRRFFGRIVKQRQSIGEAKVLQFLSFKKSKSE